MLLLTDYIIINSTLYSITVFLSIILIAIAIYVMYLLIKAFGKKIDSISFNYTDISKYTNFITLFYTLIGLIGIYYIIDKLMFNLNYKNEIIEFILISFIIIVIIITSIVYLIVNRSLNKRNKNKA